MSQYLLLYLLHESFVILEKLLDVVAALTETHLAVVEPRAAFLHDVSLDRKIDQFADTADALAVHDVEFRFLERRSDLVLDDLRSGAGADHLAV